MGNGATASVRKGIYNGNIAALKIYHESETQEEFLKEVNIIIDNWTN